MMTWTGTRLEVDDVDVLDELFTDALITACRTVTRTARRHARRALTLPKTARKDANFVTRRDQRSVRGLA